MVTPLDGQRHAEGVGAGVKVRVPAKVNLFLAVRGQRPDGFHDIVSVMHTVGLYDDLTARCSGASFHPSARRRMHVTLAHDGGTDVPVGDDNLVLRAARALAGAIGADSGDAEEAAATHLDLCKRIPVGAGMGGGSADAAATLVALNRLWECGFDHGALRELGAGLGADVPFCVTGGTALATGTGVATAQVLCRGTYDWVVGISEDPLSTGDVYAAWDEIGEPTEIEPDAVLQALRSDDRDALGAALHNDLEQAAFHLRPSLRGARDAMLVAGALGAVVSGSGPTVVGLAEDAVAAAAIAREVARYFDRTEVVRSPVGGPELLQVV